MVKRLTLQEIDRGIGKFQRRIEDLRALDPSQLSLYDQKVRNIELRIRTAVRDIFGPDSVEYKGNEPYLIADLGQRAGGGSIYHEAVAVGIPQAIAMLEGLIGLLEEKKSELGEDSTARVLAAFEGLDLHPRIASVCADLYRDGHYRNAVLDGCLALVNFVKEKSRRHDLDGAKLMREVFSKNNPLLAFNDLSNQTDLDEQEGMMHLFEGVVLALRNPRAHTLLDDSPELALEYIALLSLLAKRLEQTKRCEGNDER